jgi:hypothetical protein
MAEFVKGNQLNSALEEIFEKAESQMVLISPFIKLHSRFIDVLKSKIKNYNLEITIVFGKNEDNLSKSFNLEDFKLLKDFPNIKIKYEPRLHAKYYSNESSALLSSMNLYDFSQNNNIEFGILTKVTNSIGNLLGDTLDKDAFTYFEQVISNSKTLYKRVPLYEEKMFGLSKKYVDSETEINELEETLGQNLTHSKKTFSRQSDIKNFGYCIRTGEKIPFNPEKPFSEKAFESWNKYKDENYKEKYCHFSGENSNGETSFSKPILKKNWNKAKSKIK